MTRGAAYPGQRLTCDNVPHSKAPPRRLATDGGAGPRGLPPYVFRPEADSTPSTGLAAGESTPAARNTSARHTPHDDERAA